MPRVNLGISDWRTSVIQDSIDTHNGLISDDPSIAPVNTRQVIVTAPQILNMKAVPVQIFPAPGLGKVIDLHEIMVQYRFNATGYGNTGANDIVMYWQAAGSGSPMLTLNSNGFLNALVDRICDYGSSVVQVDRSKAENQPVMMAHSGGSTEFSNGNGDLVITCIYRVINLV